MSVGLALGSGDPSLIDVFPTNSTASFASVMVNGNTMSNDVLLYETITLDTGLDAGLVGLPINVSLLFDSENKFGRVALFDNVGLPDAPDTPEPGSLVLVAVGGLLMAAGAIRRKTRMSSAAISCKLWL